MTVKIKIQKTHKKRAEIADNDEKKQTAKKRIYSDFLELEEMTSLTDCLDELEDIEMMKSILKKAENGT